MKARGQSPQERSETADNTAGGNPRPCPPPAPVMYTGGYISSSPTSGGGFSGPTGYLWVWK
jgi:hypothetical protein